MMDLPFDLSRLTPRPCQREVLELAQGERGDDATLYVVCPPGSGKTILGLMLALRMRARTLVLAPNTAIQSQWIHKARLFEVEGGGSLATADPSDTAPIKVLTYQALAQASDVGESERQEIREAWLVELTGAVAEGSDESPPKETEEPLERDEAEQWLRAFEQENPERYEEALLARRKRRRLSGDQLTLDELVSSRAAAIVGSLKQRGVSLIIFDECHHLVGFWAQVVLALRQELAAARVLALTATPPAKEDLSNREIELHNSLLGEVDYFLPTPAVVRDGNLAPYQDLVYFTRPTPGELQYLAGCSERLRDVLQSVEQPGRSRLSKWLKKTLDEIPAAHLPRELRRRIRFLTQAVSYLKAQGVEINGLLATLAPRPLSVDDQAELIGRFAVGCLLVSRAQPDRALFNELAWAFRPLGFQLTTSGLRRCQSTVNRVLALSSSKTAGLCDILRREMKSHSDVRALVVTDFEKSSATIDKRIEHLMTAESGGAVAAMRALTSDATTDELDPILVTGSTVLVDDDLLPRFLEEAGTWFKEQGLDVDLRSSEEVGFYRITGRGRDWTTRHYVMMITYLFETGLTRCLVGTRGLLGEGWDSLSLNTLIDLTTAATRMTVNQLRGRAIRLDPKVPKKVANIWDVVCMAPELEQGLSDYHRLARKHEGYHGLCDDGAIEAGLGHLHPALTEAGPEEVALNAHLFNAEMLERAALRSETYRKWQVGAPYRNREVPTLEIRSGELFGGFAVRRGESFAVEAGEMVQNICRAVEGTMRQLSAFEDGDAKFVVTPRADGYYRVALESNSETDMTRFASAVAEIFEPISNQRYIIPRFEERRHHNWFSRMLPEVLGKYLCRRERFLAVYHPVPALFAGKKTRADCFSNYWNQFVSEGRAVFTQRGKGEQVVAEARGRNQTVLEARAKLRSVWH